MTDLLVPFLLLSGLMAVVTWQVVGDARDRRATGQPQADSKRCAALHAQRGPEPEPGEL